MSEGVFTPTKSPCERMFPERPKARVPVAVIVASLAPCLDVERILLYPDRQGGDDEKSLRIPSLTVGIQVRLRHGGWPGCVGKELLASASFTAMGKVLQCWNSVTRKLY
jgi:hypothetical protein